MTKHTAMPIEVGTIVSQGLDVLRVVRVWINEKGLQCVEFERVASLEPL